MCATCLANPVITTVIADVDLFDEDCVQFMKLRII
jgi:hypothetical protein